MKLLIGLFLAVGLMAQVSQLPGDTDGVQGAGDLNTIGKLTFVALERIIDQAEGAEWDPGSSTLSVLALSHVDFSAAFTQPHQTGDTLPATCTVGQTYFKTDAIAGTNVYGCTTTDVWTPVGGTPGSGGPPEAHAPSHETGGSDLLDLPSIPGQLPDSRITVDATNGTPLTAGGLKDWVLSAGQITGGNITDGGSQTINVAAGTGLIRSGINDLDPITTFEWPAANGLAIPLNASRYVYVEYNAGSPQVVLDAGNLRSYNSDVFLGIASNDQTEIKISFVPWRAGNVVGSHKDWISGVFGTQRDRLVGGLNVTANGTFVQRDAGALWAIGTKLDIPALDTSGTDTFDSYYRDGVGGFTKITNVSLWPPDQYDDGSGTLDDLGNNNYGTLWWAIDAGGNQAMVYGSSNVNTIAAAQNEPQPSAPDFIGATAIFISRWIIREGETAPILEESFFQALQSGVPVSHNSTTNRDAPAAHPASSVTNVPAAGVTETDVQGAIDGLETRKLDRTDVTSVGLTATIGDGSTVITAGTYGYLEIPFACTIDQVTLYGDVSGSVAVDIEKAPSPTFQTSTSICSAGTCPALSSSTRFRDSSLTSWTTGIVADDVLTFKVTGTPASTTKVQVAIRCNK